MTIEKLQFALPAVFTIGPDNKPEALKKYALLLSGSPDGHPQKGTIAPTARSHVQEIVKELDQFGLCIYNANVKELQDTPGSEYFAFLSRKAHEGASNQAKVDVAEARMRGEIGEAAKKGHTKQEIAKIDAETAILETKRKGDKAQADAELTNRQTELDMGIQLAQIQARRRAEARDTELQKEVETKKAETELERLRAKDLVKSKIARETAQQEADAKLYQEQKSADGKNYNQKAAADAQYYNELKGADGRLYANSKDAEMGLFKQTKKAEG
jgi:flotillin